MIRRPTPEVVLMAYHTAKTGGVVMDRAALAHLARRHDEDVEPGFYRMRMVRGGPFVPVRVWMRQEIDPDTGDLTADETLEAEIGGKPASIAFVASRWLWLEAITEHSFIALSAESARADGVGDAMRATHARMDLSQEFITP